MTPEALEALKKSIEHWERLASGTAREGEGIRSKSCPLCALYVQNFCQGCPVAEQTIATGCAGTPWRGASDAHSEFGQNSAQFHFAAIAELDFLRSILAKAEANKPTEAQ